MKKYTINGTEYRQQALVIGQLARLLDELQGVRITDLSPVGLISAFGAKLPRLLACVLIPVGQDPRVVEVDTLAVELWEVELDTALEVLADFLAMARLASRLEQISKLLIQAQSQAETGPGSSALPSQAVTH